MQLFKLHVDDEERKKINDFCEELKSEIIFLKMEKIMDDVSENSYEKLLYDTLYMDYNENLEAWVGFFYACIPFTPYTLMVANKDRDSDDFDFDIYTLVNDYGRMLTNSLQSIHTASLLYSEILEEFEDRILQSYE